MGKAHHTRSSIELNNRIARMIVGPSRRFKKKIRLVDTCASANKQTPALRCELQTYLKVFTELFCAQAMQTETPVMRTERQPCGPKSVLDQSKCLKSPAMQTKTPAMQTKTPAMPPVPKTLNVAERSRSSDEKTGRPQRVAEGVRSNQM